MDHEQNKETYGIENWNLMIHLNMSPIPVKHVKNHPFYFGIMELHGEIIQEVLSGHFIWK